MRTLKLTLSYDGTQYAGWQVQARGQLSVQEVVERAIQQVTGARVRIMASGRTDAGVHALGQVVRWHTESELPCGVLVRALNANLPQDIAVLSAVEVREEFHATVSAVRKRYRYLIHNSPVRDVFRRRYSWHCPMPLDVSAMACAADCLVGTHDFSSFETSGSERQTSVRTVFALEVKRGEGAEQSLIIIEIEANGFLYNMVRSIVGTLVQVGGGYRPASWVAEVLAAQDRRQAGRTAPPQGLFLVNVEYGEGWEAAGR